MNGKDYLRLNQDNAGKYPIYLKEGYANHFWINPILVENYLVITEEGHHCFSGYYDVDNVSPDGNYLLYLSVKERDQPGKSKALINAYDLKNGGSVRLSKTNAWCWQQGCRMRWIDEDTIMFNDFFDGHYVSKTFSLTAKELKTAFDSAFYDVSSASRVGLSLNFDRLQAIRPGYGYSNRPDQINGLSDTGDGGIWATDLRTKEKRLVVGLRELQKEVSSSPNDIHYVNHISISPSGNKFMFFHCWAKDPLDMWKMRMIVSNLDGSNRIVLEDRNLISHYCWISDEKLLVTKQTNGEWGYWIYDVNNLGCSKIDAQGLINDGHPTMLRNKSVFVSDTYPLEYSCQALFLYDMHARKKETIFEGFSDPRLYIEKRCDLHPKISKGKNLINVDSTYKGGVRSVILLKMKEGKYDV